MEILFGCLGFPFGVAVIIVASNLWHRESRCSALAAAFPMLVIAAPVIIWRGYAEPWFYVGAAAGAATLIMLMLLLVGVHVYLLKTDTKYRLKAALRRFGDIHGRD